MLTQMQSDGFEVETVVNHQFFELLIEMGVKSGDFVNTGVGFIVLVEFNEGLPEQFLLFLIKHRITINNIISNTLPSIY